MNNRFFKYITNLLLPYLLFSVAAGFFSALLITAFKLGAEWVIHLSSTVYGYVRANPSWVPLLLLVCAALGLVVGFILSYSHSCRGGGIPTSVAAIRGITTFHWLKGVFLLPFSALLTFLCGIPLGTEGPCVQMGTAIGDGVVKCLGKDRHKGWRRYIMTGGASAGFSIATSSPITAVIFSMEELHNRFSPLLLTVASISVTTAQITVQILNLFGIKPEPLFCIPESVVLSPRYLFAPILVGLACGACSILFTRFYSITDKLTHKLLKKISSKIVFPVLFALVSVVGFFVADSLGTGHSLIESLFHAESVWYTLILVFLIRAILMMISNTSGTTGGVFLPTLAFGAIIGAICAKCMIALGWISPDHYILMVILGITAFLGATSRIPITACVFAIEAMNVVSNVLPIIIATTAALIVVESSGLEDFTDAVIEAKMRSISRGKTPTVAEVTLTVSQSSFVAGKELRDILWPNNCVVISFERAKQNHGRSVVGEGDVITLHYKTYDAEATAEELKILIGEDPVHTESAV